MKKTFLTAVAFLAAATTANAADLPATPMPARMPLAVPMIFSWTGCYVGVEGGANWGRSEQIARSGPAAGNTITGKFDLSGGIAGGTVGCNYQISNFVVGIEDDYSWTNKQGSAPDLPPFLTTNTNTTREKWIDTLRGRFGYTPWDTFMVYGTAGVAWAGVDATVSNPAWGSLTESKTRTGWTAGVGGEWAAWNGPWGALTFKLEYLHAGFDSKRYVTPPFTTPVGTIVVSRDVKLSDDMVRAGMNVKFNWGGPAVPRY
jgi:outer membrane immunogenic protein